MKSVSGDMAAHLLQDLTTLATCWKIIRRDGVHLFFTDSDKNLVVDGDTYLCASGYTRTAIENDTTLAPDNLNVMGFLDNDLITAEDLRAGAYDFAEVFVFSVNWNDLSMGILKHRRGWFGEVTLGQNGVFNAELRGLTQALSQRIGEVFSPQCRADLGDSRCKIPIDPPLIQRLAAYTVGQFVKVATSPLSFGEESQGEYENRIYLVTRAGETGVTQPVFDTTIGATTTDTDVKATSTLHFTGNATNASTVTVGTKTYTFQSVLTNTDGHVLLGATMLDSVENLFFAMTLGPGSGTKYAAATTAHTSVDFADDSTGDILLTAKVAGSAGNSIATTETIIAASFPHTTLTGGLDGAQFQAQDAWMREAIVQEVISRSEIVIEVDDIRANADGWFTNGGAIFETGDNAGLLSEIKDWQAGTAGGILTFFIAPNYAVQVGDILRLYPGCDKTVTQCIDKFNNILNFRGEPYLPGTDSVLAYPNAQ